MAPVLGAGAVFFVCSGCSFEAEYVISLMTFFLIAFISAYSKLQTAVQR